ncbi:hypothetical protein ACIPRD_11305 [Streptomyces sp. NPDC090108]|uniref:hypothetical protein n=1 Tax=Streptomyces sp. NPDC090108 TaxID=3365947 RepID=UPI00380C1B8A
MTVASSEEVLHLREQAGPAAVFGCERQYGVLAEGPVDARQDQPRTAEISAEG